MQNELLDAVRTIPGVEAAASVEFVPLSGESWQGSVLVNKVTQQRQAYFNRVSPGYFSTLRTRLIAGREFTENDLPTSHVAIVNESFVRMFLPDGSAVGRTFQLPTGQGRPEPAFEIVGVVQDSKYDELRAPPPPTAYFPNVQNEHPSTYVNLLVRSPSSLSALAISIERAVRRVDPAVVLYLKPLGRHGDRSDRGEFKSS